MKEIILKNNEKILSERRTYFLFNFWPFLISFTIVFGDAFFMFYLFSRGVFGQVVFYSTLVFALLIFVRTYFIWRKNIFIITNQRIIDVEQRSFFEKIISEFYFNQIEDVHVKLKGFFSSLFNYGDLNIQIKNSKVKIIVSKIKNPIKIQQMINFLKEKNKEKQNHDLEENLGEFIMEKIFDLDFSELIRIKKIIDKRINELNNLEKQ